VEALRNVGVAHLQLKQLGDAAQAFEGVLKIKPNDETARKGLAMIRAR
jgi:Tfp pilus assembly protein PilF